MSKKSLRIKADTASSHHVSFLILILVIFQAPSFAVADSGAKEKWISRCLPVFEVLDSLQLPEQFSPNRWLESTSKNELAQVRKNLSKLLNPIHQENIARGVIRLQTQVNDIVLDPGIQEKTGATKLGELLDLIEIAHAACPVFKKKPNTPFPIKDRAGLPILKKEEISRFCEVMEVVGPVLKSDGLTERSAAFSHALKQQIGRCRTEIEGAYGSKKGSEVEGILSDLAGIERFSQGFEKQVLELWQAQMRAIEQVESTESRPNQQDVR